MISIEANPILYGTDFLISTEEAIDFIVKLNRDYIGLNLDIGTILYNQEKMDSIKGYEKFISHVHISEPCLLEIKERKEHKDILNLLKVVGYDKAVSIEMQKQESIEGICKAMRYIKRIINS